MPPVLLAPNGQPQANQPLKIASPLNDVQLVALVAAQVHAGRESAEYATGVAADDAREAVGVAVEIVAQAVIQTPGLQGRVAQLQRG